MPNPELTIVIPTRNRAPFVARLLSYYASLSCPFPILIGDSSADEDFAKTTQAIARLRGRLAVEQIRFPSHEGYAPGTGTIECVSGLLKRVETPYNVFVADDDFIVLGAMEEGMRFLERHPDYSSVIGDAGFFTLEDAQDAAHGEIRHAWRYLQFSIEEPKAQERLRRYLACSITTEYSVKRTEQARAQWEAALELGIDNRFGELLVGGLGVVWGKVKKIERLFMFRQNHETMTSRQNEGETHFDSLLDARFASRYSAFRDALAEALAHVDGIPYARAQAFVKQCFWSRLIAGLKRKWDICYSDGRNQSRLDRVRSTLVAVPVLRRLQRSLQIFLPHHPRAISLPALLQWTSRYRADFLPIDKAITQPLPEPISLWKKGAAMQSVKMEAS